jgi:hypothetical protein
MAASPFTAAEKTFLFKFLAGKGGKERSITMPDLYKIFKNPGKYPKDEQVLKGVIEMKMGKKEGGRIGYKDAGSVLKGQRRDPYEIIAGMDNELNPGLLDKIPFFGAGKYPLDEDQGASLIKQIQDYKYGESYPNETIGVMEKGVFNVIPKPDRLPMSMEQTISTMEAEWDKAIEEGHRPGRGGKFDDLGIYSKEDIRRRVELGFDQARGPEIQKRNMRAANGGRIGFEGGGINIGIGTFYPERVKEILSNAGESIKSNPELIPSPYLNMSQLEKLKDIKGGVADVYKNIKDGQSGVVQGFKDETRKYKLFFSLPSEDKKKMRELGMEMLDVEEYLDMKNSKVGKKDGGRMGFMMGSEVPLRQNQAGVNEMDYRNTGGFVPPIGVKERADDIPAMLSNNEFVFTADAVRAAGGGSVNKGAQKMYALMKQLEGKVV